MNEADSRFSMRFEGVTLLDRYEVGEELGAGGMATVYRGTDTQLGMPVVVKVPHVALLADRTFRDRFHKEIQDLVVLRHPHIVTILARGEHDEVPFLVQQYLDGGSLEDRLHGAGGGAFAIADAAKWIRDVAGALDFMHARGVVHRDVKPANVLFDEHGYVYLSDFGIAKAMGGTETGLTMTGATPGSPTYMAPEQARAVSLSGQADQYALASTVFEALTGRPPFEGENVLEVLVRKQSEDPPQVADMVAVPAAVDQALARALHRDPDERFASCADFADSLLGGDPAPRTQPVPAGLPPEAKPTPAPQVAAEETSFGVGRPDADVLPPTTQTSATGSGTPAIAPGATQTFVVPDPGAGKPKRRGFLMSVQFTSLLVLAVVGVGVFMVANRGQDGPPNAETAGDRRAPPPSVSHMPPAMAKRARVEPHGTWVPDWDGLRTLLAKGGDGTDGFQNAVLDLEGKFTFRMVLAKDQSAELFYEEAGSGDGQQSRTGSWREVAGGQVEIRLAPEDGIDPSDQSIRAWFRESQLVIQLDNQRMLMKRRP